MDKAPKTVGGQEMSKKYLEMSGVMLTPMLTATNDVIFINLNQKSIRLV